MFKNISMILVIVGGLNWGLVGVTGLIPSVYRFDLVEYIFTDLIGLPVLSYLVYIVVALAAIHIAVEAIRE